MHELTDDLVRTWSNMPAARLYIDVHPEPIPDDLAAFIRNNANWPQRRPMPLDSPDSETRRLAVDYQDLGLRVLGTVLHVTNRVVAWAYAERGQYWLEEREIESSMAMMMSRNNEFNARASIDSGPLVRWCPPFRDTMVVVAHRNGLQSDDWLALTEFLRERERRPSLVGELLGNAKALLSQGHNRAALIEGVTALEVAFRAFLRRPHPVALQRAQTVTGGHLKATVEHLGFTAMVKYLLPLILEGLPKAHAVSCAALDERHSVVHHGQRDVGREKARRYLSALTELTRFLESATSSDEGVVRPDSETA